MPLEPLAMWLEGSPPARFIATTLWAYPLVSAVHLLGIALVVGSALPVDLRRLRLVGPQFDPALESLVRTALVGFAVAADTSGRRSERAAFAVVVGLSSGCGDGRAARWANCRWRFTAPLACCGVHRTVDRFFLKARVAPSARVLNGPTKRREADGEGSLRWVMVSDALPRRRNALRKCRLLPGSTSG